MQQRGGLAPVLFDGGYRLNSDGYIDVMTSIINPWIRKVAGKKKFVFQLDGAPAHTANKTQPFLKKIDFWPKSMWPPQCPDLNPLDYSVWWRVESSACKTQSQNVEELKARITENWANFDKGYVVDVCRTFRGRWSASSRPKAATRLITKSRIYLID